MPRIVRPVDLAGELRDLGRRVRRLETRTAPPPPAPVDTSVYVCTVSLTADTSITANTDTWAAGGWSAVTDPSSMFTAGSPCYITIPYAGRYEVRLRVSIAVGTGGVAACGIAVNSAAVGSCIARDARDVTTAGADHTRATAACDWYFAAGDTIYWESWSNNAATLYASVLNVPADIHVRYVGAH